MYRVEGDFQAHVPLSLRETVQKYTNKGTMPQVSRSRCELQSVMAELLWRSWEGVTVVPSDVGADAAAALAPPLVTVSSQTGESNKQTSIKQCHLTSLPFATFLLCGVFTWLGCSVAWRSTPGHHHCHNAVDCRRNKPWRRRHDQEAQSHSARQATHTNKKKHKISYSYIIKPLDCISHNLLMAQDSSQPVCLMTTTDFSFFNLTTF